ncbi:hypothetical protein [Archangium lipolyticum]|nr:hypothetical protein [Archangium lipolyticum]
MRTEPKQPLPKKPYSPPRVKSERIIVPDLFQPTNCDPFGDPRPECL